MLTVEHLTGGTLIPIPRWPLRGHTHVVAAARSRPDGCRTPQREPERQN